MSPVYAVPDDLDDYMATVPADAEILIRRASRTIARATVTAVYAVGSDQLPTDTALAAALKEATCEQVAYGVENGDQTGTGAAVGYRRVKIGSVELERGTGAGGGASSGGLAPQAREVLAAAGLLGGEPWSW